MECTKEEILVKFLIREETFGLWVKLLGKPVELGMESSQLVDKDKMKLAFCNLLREISLKEFYDKFKVTQCQIGS